MFGLATRGQDCYSRKVVKLDDDVVDKFVLVKDRLDTKTLCHCAVESFPVSLTTSTRTNDIESQCGGQNGSVALVSHELENAVATSVTIKLARVIDGWFEIEVGGTPHDVEAVLHVLRHTRGCSNVVISLHNCSMSDEHLKKLTNILSNTGTKLKVRDLALCGDQVGGGVIRLLDNAYPALSSLEEVMLVKCGITDFPPRLGTTLTLLWLDNNPLGVSGNLLLLI